MTNASSLFTNEITATFERREQAVGDHLISYRIRDGKDNPDRTFILVHGATATSFYYDILGAELSKLYQDSRIILLDLPWHGKSISPMDKLQDATVYTYASVVEDFIAVAMKSGIISGKINWVGWSMGGSIGQILALAGVPIDELVLLNSSPIWNSIKTLRETVPHASNPDSIHAFYRNVLIRDLVENIEDSETEEILGRFSDLVSSPEVMVNDFKAILPEFYDVREELSKISQKTLIVSGLQDHLAEVKYQYLFSEKIANSDLVLMDDNHMMLIKPSQAVFIAEEIKSFFG